MTGNPVAEPPAQRGRATSGRCATFVRALALSLVALQGGEAAAPATACDAAAERAARQHGVPLDLLKAIGLVESGRRKNGRWAPWPWTANVAGAGRWFDTPEAAIAHVRAQLSSGVKSIDVGCFQINHVWHGEAFASLEQMFDPVSNADYAARFLQRLRAETGSWKAASGAYHSRNETLAEPYRERLARAMAHLGGDVDEATPSSPPLAQESRPDRALVARRPLLSGGSPASLASLVPRQDAPRPFLPLVRP